MPTRRGTCAGRRKPQAGARSRDRSACAGLRAFPFPEFERDYEFVALRHPGRISVQRRTASSRIAISTSTSPITRPSSRNGTSRIRRRCIRLVKRRGAYLVGPLARYALNFDRLPASVQALAREAGLGPVCRNPFQQHHRAGARDRLCLRGSVAPDRRLRAAGCRRRCRSSRAQRHGFGCTEAPRGICWHRYEFDADGTIRAARIVPPTSQNQAEHRSRSRRPSRHRCWISPTTSFATAANRASAITIPASLARHISSSCRCIEHEQAATAVRRKVLVVGLGNPDRGDDGVGLLVAKKLPGRSADRRGDCVAERRYA